VAVASVSLFRISVFYDEVFYESLLQYSIMCVVCVFFLNNKSNDIIIKLKIFFIQ